MMTFLDLFIYSYINKYNKYIVLSLLYRLVRVFLNHLTSIYRGEKFRDTLLCIFDCLGFLTRKKTFQTRNTFE